MPVSFFSPQSPHKYSENTVCVDSPCIRFEQWWKFCDRKDTKYKTHHKVCNLHFPENCFGESVKVQGFHPPKIYTGINISHENQNFSGIDSKI